MFPALRVGKYGGAQHLNRQINQTVNSGQKLPKGKLTTEFSVIFDLQASKTARIVEVDRQKLKNLAKLNKTINYGTTISQILLG